MKSIVALFLMFSFFYISDVCAQSIGQGGIWYLGANSGFDFKYDPPKVLLDGKIFNQNGRTSTMTDELGDLQFYTNGDTVWNKNHEIMLNGTELNLYRNDAPITSVIVPHPGDGQLYYIFITTRGAHFNTPASAFVYAVVDLSGNNGEGSVIQKNMKLIDGSTTLLTVTTDAREDSFWVITHGNDDNNFYSYHITGSGISAPVVSAVGPYYSQDSWQMKISPDATKLVVTEHCQVGIFNFNSSLGIVSNYRRLDVICGMGVEFSPNSELMYLVGESIGGDHYGYVYQYDVSFDDVNKIADSEIEVGHRFNYGSLFDLQLAYNGKIYAGSMENTDSLVVINFPNKKGKACGYDNRGLKIKNRYFPYLPTSVQSYYRDSPAIVIQSACKDMPTEIRVTGLGYADSLIWNLGDGTIESHSAANGKIINHSYSSTGDFRIKVRKYIGDVYRDMSSIITVIDAPIVNLGADTTICKGESLALNAGNNDLMTYSWSTGKGLPEIIILQEGIYSVLVDNGVCSASDTIKVHVRNFPAVELGPDKVICDQDSTELVTDATESYSYQWSSGEESNAITARVNGDYGVTVNNGRCSTSDQVHVNFAGVRNLSLSETFIEATYGEHILLNSEGLNIDAWEWTFGDGSKQSTTGPTTTYSYKKAGHYKGQLIASNSFGCSEKIAFEVNIPYHLFIPNVFTPDNDGVNDSFEIQYNGIEDLNVFIYNRWGEVVFSTNTLEKMWNGSNASTGTYYYNVHAGNTIYKGWVAILR
jgi:gliding motility-associated-like protein